MPANFPEIWLGRVIQNLNTADVATFLEGIPELDVDVTQINGGTPTEMNKIYVPTTEFEADILINNTTYPIPFQEYEDGTIEITLDKYQTKVITLPDDKTLGSSYDIIDTATKGTTRPILTTKNKKAIHAIAPQTNTVKTPVLAATGGAEALADASGRLRLTYEDLVIFKGKCDDGEWPAEDRRLVLCTNHWNDLLLDRKNFGNQLVDYAKGKPSPVIAGFELHTYIAMPLFTAAGAKRPYGVVADPTDKTASVAFVKEAIAKKTGITTQYFTPAAINPTRQSNDLSYRHYFIVTPYKTERIGAII